MSVWSKQSTDPAQKNKQSPSLPQGMNILSLESMQPIDCMQAHRREIRISTLEGKNSVGAKENFRLIATLWSLLHSPG